MCKGKSGAKTVAIDKLITGAYETSLASDELLAGVEIPLPAKTQRAAYLKFQLKERPTLGLALVLDVDGDNIKKAAAVVGSVSAVPTQSEQSQRAAHRRASRKSKNNSATPPKRLAQAADPVDDLEGSADYKRHLIGVFLRRAFTKALA